MRIPERETDNRQSVEFLNIKQEDGYIGDFILKIIIPLKNTKKPAIRRPGYQAGFLHRSGCSL